ncbi:MAG: hypothetical protein NT156_07605 [Mycobacterium sp.]|nr:hypothetical protein [Mycobacterium sp.]
MGRMRRGVTLGALVALMATAVGSGAAAADEVDGTQDIAGTGDVADSQDASNQDAGIQEPGNQDPTGAQDVFLHNVVYRARVTGLARGALVGYRISDTQINSADPTMLPGRTFEATGTLTDPKEAGMRISIQWPYSASLHCEILVDDQLVIQADQFIAPRLTPAKDDPDYGAMNCGAPLSNATGIPLAPEDLPPGDMPPTDIPPTDMPAMDFSAPAAEPAAAPS